MPQEGQPMPKKYLSGHLKKRAYKNKNRARAKWLRNIKKYFWGFDLMFLNILLQWEAICIGVYGAG